MITIEQLRAWRDAKAAESEEPQFMGKPDSWFKDIHWFCLNGHVSGVFLKCEEDGDRCLSCHAPVLMGPPIGEREFADVIAKMQVRLTEPQRRVLKSAIETGNPTQHIHGQAAWGGWSGTRAALQRKGYLNSVCLITEAGRAAYAADQQGK